jgi:Spy/CpxP family protein refolding chaperone
MRLFSCWLGIWVLVMVAISAACCADSEMAISESQKDQLKALASSTRERTSRERDALRRARAELVQVYSSYDLDEHKAKAAQDKISAAQLNLLNIHLDNEIALRDILTSDQFQAFRKLMKRHMRDPRMLVLAPPEDAILDKLPDKQMLDSLGIPAEQRKRLEPASGNTRAIQGLRDSTKQLLELYSNFDLDSDAARKLIGSIHRRQAYLLMLQHYRQKAIRQVFSEDQFETLRQEIAKRMAEREPRHERDRDHRRQ